MDPGSRRARSGLSGGDVFRFTPWAGAREAGGMSTPPSPKNAIAVILAGGKGTRIGGATKATLKVGGLTLLERVRGALMNQAKTVLLSVAAHQMDDDWVAASGLPVVTDPVAEAGPLGGIAGALVWARA